MKQHITDGDLSVEHRFSCGMVALFLTKAHRLINFCEQIIHCMTW